MSSRWPRTATLVVLLGVALLASATAAAVEPGAEPQFQWSTIPSQSCRGLWLVSLASEAAPGQTLEMVLDTGASYTAIDPDAIHRITGKRVRSGKKVRLKRLSVGPLEIGALRARSHEMDHLARALGTPMDGILGFPVFKDLLLALDYPAGEIRVATGALPPVDSITIFQDIGRVRPFLAFDLDGQPLPLLIDSGSAGGLTLHASDELEWQAEPRALSSAVRYESVVVERTGRAAGTYRFGSLDLTRPIIDLAERGSRFAGYKMLRRFEWVFDTRNRRIRMTPTSDAPLVSEPHLGTGIATRPIEDGLEVIQVFPLTPAAEVDLLEGDVITRIDGTPVFERGCRSLAESTTEASEMRLTVRRGNELLDRPLPIAVLVH